MVSVIVPVYKVEKYLHRCVDSILNQTYENLEVILVDDGSPDHCPQICDEYARKDSRVKVIHQKNGGLSAARNAGLDIATGDYIAFVDSDDSISSNMFEFMVRTIEETNADIVKTGILEIVGTKIKKIAFENKSYETEGLGGLFHECRGGAKWAVVWNGLYRHDLIKDIKFPVGYIHEDNYFSSMSVYFAKRVITTEECLYSHYYNETGIIANSGTRPLDRALVRILLRKKLRKLNFFSRKLDKAIAIDLCHYICRDNLFVSPRSMRHGLWKYLLKNLDFRRILLLRYCIWQKGIVVK